MPLYNFACPKCKDAPEIEVLTTYAKAERVRLSCQCGALMERRIAAPSLKADGAYSFNDKPKGRAA